MRWLDSSRLWMCAPLFGACLVALGVLSIGCSSDDGSSAQAGGAAGSSGVSGSAGSSGNAGNAGSSGSSGSAGTAGVAGQSQSDVRWVSYTSAQGTNIHAALFTPDNPGPRPVIVILHGSGGMMLTGHNVGEGDPTQVMDGQFVYWGATLQTLGYAVIIPSSYESRGFIDWDHRPAGMDDPTRLVFQVYDAYGALATTCNLPGVDCFRAGVLGFSAGATATLMTQQTNMANLPQFSSLGSAIQGEFKTAVAYYPGCGLSDLVSLSSPDAYFPSAPVQVWHASLDPLVENCATRESQAATAASEHGQSKNPFSLFVYPGVGHGFDSGPTNDVETAAQQDARPKTQAIFSSILSP